jgi:hypothetical protein
MQNPIDNRTTTTLQAAAQLALKTNRRLLFQMYPDGEVLGSALFAEVTDSELEKFAAPNPSQWIKRSQRQTVEMMPVGEGDRYICILGQYNL